jgi:hypothetical protein
MNLVMQLHVPFLLRVFCGFINIDALRKFADLIAKERCIMNVCVIECIGRMTYFALCAKHRNTRKQ